MANAEEFDSGYVPTTVVETFPNCAACLPPLYYRLESCNASNPLIIYTAVDLSAYAGKTITVDEYDGCFNLTVFTSNVPSTVIVTLQNNYPNCVECAAPRYKLTDCDGVRPSIYTTTNLSAYLSSIVKLTFYPDTCWSVSTTNVNSSDDTVIIASEFASCEICSTNTVAFCSTITNNSLITQIFQFKDSDGILQSITLDSGKTSRKYCVYKWIYPTNWPFEKIFTNDGACVDGKCPSNIPFRSIRPGYNSPACSTAYYERIACSYSEILYKDVIAQRYGIASCCHEEELYRLDIKYQLLELQAINNPNYICKPFSECCQDTTDCGCGCNNNSCQQTTNCGCGCNS
jgi:hypothetical protein